MPIPIPSSTSRPALLLLVVSLGAACSDTAAPPGGSQAGADMTAPPTPRPIEVILAPTQPSLDFAPPSPRFDFTKMVDLWVRVKVPPDRLAAETVLKLQFISPKGSLFYEDNAAFSKDMAHPIMIAADVDTPLTAVPSVRLPTGAWALDRPIPVAGSAFDRYPQYGTWIVQASFDRNSPLATSSFELIPPTPR